MMRPHSIVIVALALLAMSVASSVSAQPAATTAPATQPLNQVALEKQFEQTLTDAVLVGRGTTGPNGEPKEDRYHIVKVTKQEGDNWLFQVRMRYGGKDLVIPMVLPVRWAGDTPMIQVTGLRLPGGGAGGYSARVLIYGDQYAGTWSGSKRGGHVFGRIERAGAATTQPTTRPGSS